jgi:hypothetical protein
MVRSIHQRGPVSSTSRTDSLKFPSRYWPISIYRSPRRALMLCPQLFMGIQPGSRFPARSADGLPLPATLYGHVTQAIYRNRPIEVLA